MFKLKIKTVIFYILISLSLPAQTMSSEATGFLQQYDVQGTDSSVVARFYKNKASLWHRKGKLTNQAYDALDFIASASRHGLNSDDYHLPRLHKLDPSSSNVVAQHFDVLLTDGLLALIHDLAVGRLQAHQADPEWFIPQDSFNSADFLQEALLSPQLLRQLNTLLPTQADYQKLIVELARYQRYDTQGVWPTISEIPLIRPGDSHPYIPTIQTRLAIEDNQYFIGANDVKSEQYDDLTEQAIRRFQKRHGLKVDGIIGNETRSQLNVPARDRVQQIKATLERRRWMPADLGQRYVQVNLASYTLTAVDNNTEKLAMRVIVGKNSRPTPSFASHITRLVANPYWNVPRKLAVLDLLPKQKANIDYFYLHNIRVFINESGDKVEQHPYLIDWQSVDRKTFPYILRQDPGPQNALGVVKFLFSNPWAIYLHDSPYKELFTKTKRNLSSGCIRVEDPLGFADFSLADVKKNQKLLNILVSKENKGLKLAKPLAIYVVYFTVFVYDDQVVFSADSYQRDQQIIRMLKSDN